MRQNEGKAFRTLRKDPAIREIHHGDRNLYRGTGYGMWKRTGCSVQELEVIRKDEQERRRAQGDCKSRADQIAYYVKYLGFEQWEAEMLFPA